MTAARTRVALVRGPGLSVFELQSYEPLLERYDLRAFGLAQHAVDTDTLRIAFEKLRWKDSISGRSALNAYRSRIKGERYFMPGLEEKLRGFDLIHSSEIASTFSWQCARAKKKLRAPLIITSTENIRHPAWNDAVRSKMKKEVLAAADLFFALTPDARDVLLSEGIDADKITVIPFGIDLERLSAGPRESVWSKRYKVADNDFVILFVGRFVWEKGIYDLAAAVREMDNSGIRLLFVGGGPEQKTLETFIRKIGLGNAASCHPAVSYGEMQHIYRLSDVVVLPSIPAKGIREQFGLALAEAMACGKPVVATRCGSMPWVVGDAGLLADPADSTGLAERLDCLRKSPDLRAELGAKGRRLAEERYDKNHIATAIGIAFDGVLRGRPR